MTKITILGEEPQKELKKIEFVYEIDMETGEKPIVKKSDIEPSSYGNIMLIRPAFKHGLDFMMAWDDVAKISRGFFVGHFNDGIV